MEQYSDPDRIHHYQYQSVNHSIIDHLLRHWWRLAIRLVPANSSPNAISILGNAGSWLALVLLIAWGPAAGTGFPWLYYLAAVAVFFYHTLDCLDGMQARRLGLNGPLGEFIDHWFDSFNVFFFPLGLIAAFPGIPVGWAVLTIVFCVVLDWLVLRELIDTNLMYFGPFSTEECIYTYIGFLVSVPLLGYEFWAQPQAWLGFPPVYILVWLTILGFAGRSLLIAIRLRGRDLDAIGLELLSFVPVICWLLLAMDRLGSRPVLLASLLLIGFSASRHVGDLLRSRLFGLRYPRYYPWLFAAGLFCVLLCLLAWLIPGLPGWLLWLAPLPMAAETAIGLVGQFRRSVSLVRQRLGLSLFATRQPAARGKE